jgi:hypothetical protein
MLQEMIDSLPKAQETKEGPDWFEGTMRFFEVLAALAVPIAVAWFASTIQKTIGDQAAATQIAIGNQSVAMQKAIAEQTTRKEYIQIASSILNKEVKEDEKPVRYWAVLLLNAMSPVPINGRARGLLYGTKLRNGDFMYEKGLDMYGFPLQGEPPAPSPSPSPSPSSSSGRTVNPNGSPTARPSKLASRPTKRLE